MKFVFLFGGGAVGKMTVGQELAKITGLRLFYNHMTIEPVLDVFGAFDLKTIQDLREVIFQNFAASQQYGMIFTFIWDFDDPDDWQFVAHIQDIFAPYGTEFYYVELDAPQEVRLQRNRTENRLLHKPSKRDLEQSDARLLAEERAHRMVSRPGELTFANFLRIENSHLSAAAAAAQIRDIFGL